MRNEPISERHLEKTARRKLYAAGKTQPEDGDACMHEPISERQLEENCSEKTERAGSMRKCLYLQLNSILSEVLR